jgi:hypothetical protein
MNYSTPSVTGGQKHTLSAGGAESERMILSAPAESIILSAPPFESMILSTPPEGQWGMPRAQWAAGCKAIALDDGTAVARWMA